METHAHHLHKAPSHGWKHYFFEFLMLFLAVTLGFFVENQREHYVDHQRAKKYAANLYTEMKKDSADLNHLIIWTEALVKKLDTFCILAVQRKPEVTNGMLYFYVKSVSNLTTFSSGSSTMEELKSSGNLRIMDDKIISLLNVYFQGIAQMKDDNDLTKMEYEKMNELTLKVFDGYTLATVFTRENRNARDSCFALNPPLTNDDPKLMRELVGWVKIESKYYTESTNIYLRRLSEIAGKIVETLKNEYHFKD